MEAVWRVHCIDSAVWYLGGFGTKTRTGSTETNRVMEKTERKREVLQKFMEILFIFIPRFSVTRGASADLSFCRSAF